MTASENNVYYSTIGRHLKNELNGIEFKLSEKFQPENVQLQELSKLVTKSNNGTDKYHYSFELERSVVDDFETHQLNKLSIIER